MRYTAERQVLARGGVYSNPLIHLKNLYGI